MNFNIEAIIHLFEEKTKMIISFSTDWRTFENAGYDPDQARFSFTISRDGELLDWDKSEGLESKVIPNSWHDLKCICEGSVCDESYELAVDAEELFEQESFYNMCNNVLLHCKK